MGGLEVVVGVSDGVRLPDGLVVDVRVPDGLPVPVKLAGLLVHDGGLLMLPVPLRLPVADAVRVVEPLPVLVDELEAVSDAVCVSDRVPEALLLAVPLEVGVRVALPEAVLDPVALEDGLLVALANISRRMR
jgi:hypothetical protein